MIVSDKRLRILIDDSDRCSLISSDELKSALRKCRPEESVNLAAEWLRRVWLRQDKHDTFLQELAILTEMQFQSFTANFGWRDNPAGALSGLKKRDIFARTSKNTELHEITRNLLINSLEMDGIIPLFNGSDDAGRCLFFKLEQAAAARVIDKDGKVYPEWSRRVAEIQQNSNKKYQVKIAGCDEKLTGNSLQLPVLLAIWRKESCLPEYNIFDLVATGCFKDDALRPVSGLKSKGKWLEKEVGTKVFVYPANGEELAGGEPLVPGLNFNELKTKINEIIVKYKLAPLTKAFSIEQTRLMEQKIRYGEVSNWNDVLKRLESHEQMLHKKIDFKDYFKANMLISVVLCHCGRADEAEKRNELMRQCALESGENYWYWRMMIEAVVVNTDLEDWDNAFARCEEINDNISDSSDLQMRFHGSLGQLIAFRCLRGDNYMDYTRALEHFNQAADFALKSENPGDIGHDLNYQHLYYALFAPGTPDELEYYRITRNHHNQSENREFNLDYLARQRNLAAYRSLLTNGVKLSAGRIKELPACNRNDWITATILKYQGALYAAIGEPAQAEECFDHAIKMVENAGGSVIRGIGMTIAAEAWRSLHRDEYAKHIINYFDENGSKPFAGHSRDEWLAQDNANALLSYQY